MGRPYARWQGARITLVSDSHPEYEKRYEIAPFVEIGWRGRNEWGPYVCLIRYADDRAWFQVGYRGPHNGRHKGWLLPARWTSFLKKPRELEVPLYG